MCEFISKCANIIQSWNPAILRLLDSLPYDEEVMVWGRRWIVKTSTLGEKHGYGVYVCEDIIVEDSASCHRAGPTLFLMVGLSIREDIGTGSSHNILSGRPLLLRSTPLLVALRGIDALPTP